MGRATAPFLLVVIECHVLDFIGWLGRARPLAEGENRQAKQNHDDGN